MITAQQATALSAVYPSDAQVTAAVERVLSTVRDGASKGRQAVFENIYDNPLKPHILIALSNLGYSVQRQMGSSLVYIYWGNAKPRRWYQSFYYVQF